MSSYGSHLIAKKIIVEEADIGVVKWNSFSPALPGSDDQTLAEVLSSGNDGGGADIDNVGKVVSNGVDTDSVVMPKTGINKITMDAAGTLKCQEFQLPLTGANSLNITYIDGGGGESDYALLNCREAEIYGLKIDSYIEVKTGADIDFDEGALIKGNTTTQTVCTHLDLRSTTNLFPAKYDQVISDLLALESRVSALEAGAPPGEEK